MPQMANFGFWLRGQNVVSPRGEISSIPENVHFLSRNPYGTDTQLAAKWTLKNYLMYHPLPPANTTIMAMDYLIVLADYDFAEQNIVLAPNEEMDEEHERRLMEALRELGVANWN